MALLSFLDKEFRLSDKKFNKLTMEEAKLCDWVCLEAPLEAGKIMHEILGLDWRKLPFKSLCDVLELRFGDKFYDKEEVFDYDTWNSLFFLGSKLTTDQKDFLRKHNFLPHRYTSLKQEIKELQEEASKLNISIKEYQNSNQQDLIDNAVEKLGEIDRRRLMLEHQMTKWEKENPNGGNPADAKEYLSDFVELKRWYDLNQASATGRTQMYTIIIQQMITALTQAKDGRAQNYEQDFGHFEERMRRQKERKKEEDAKNGKTGFFSFGRKQSTQEVRPKTNAGKPQEPKKSASPPLITNTTAKSSKVVKRPVEAETLVKEAPMPSFTPKPEPIKVETKVQFEQPNPKPEPKPESKPAPELRKLKHDDGESPLSDYDRIQKRVLAKQKQANKKSEGSPKSRIIVIGIIAAAALVALFLLL